MVMEEILRDGNWAADWTPVEAVAGSGAQRRRACNRDGGFAQV
jgi:hypothetical protein